MIAVTPGAKFTDIDGLGCAVAYAELLKHEGKNAIALLPGVFNESITKTVRSWSPDYETTAPSDANLVLVDVSEPKFIAAWRDLGYVTEIYDHHTGAEEYWDNRIGKQSHIEFIGAACTLIWEQIKLRHYTDHLSQTAARLLYTGILSNTLNFNADLTSPRDHQAFAELKPLTNLPADWPEQYYTETESGIMSDVNRAIQDDTKVLEVPNLGLTLAISQLELWDASSLLPAQASTIKNIHAAQPHPWFHTSPSISEGKNYLYTEDAHIKQQLTTAIRAQWDGDFGKTSRLYLRKEILKALLQLKHK